MAKPKRRPERHGLWKATATLLALVGTTVDCLSTPSKNVRSSALFATTTTLQDRTVKELWQILEDSDVTMERGLKTRLKRKQDLIHYIEENTEDGFVSASSSSEEEELEDHANTDFSSLQQNVKDYFDRQIEAQEKDWQEMQSVLEAHGLVSPSKEDNNKVPEDRPEPVKELWQIFEEDEPGLKTRLNEKDLVEELLASIQDVRHILDKQIAKQKEKQKEIQSMLEALGLSSPSGEENNDEPTEHSVATESSPDDNTSLNRKTVKELWQMVDDSMKAEPGIKTRLKRKQDLIEYILKNQQVHPSPIQDHMDTDVFQDLLDYFDTQIAKLQEKQKEMQSKLEALGLSSPSGEENNDEPEEHSVATESSPDDKPSLNRKTVKELWQMIDDSMKAEPGIKTRLKRKQDLIEYILENQQVHPSPIQDHVDTDADVGAAT